MPTSASHICTCRCAFAVSLLWYVPSTSVWPPPSGSSSFSPLHCGRSVQNLGRERAPFAGYRAPPSGGCGTRAERGGASAGRADVRASSPRRMSAGGGAGQWDARTRDARVRHDATSKTRVEYHAYTKTTRAPRPPAPRWCARRRAARER